MPERRVFLLSCEHGGNRVPQAYRDLFAGREDQLNSHRGYDPGALPLARLLAKELPAPLVAAEITRLLVDLNRSPNHRALFSEAVRELSAAARQELLELYYLPYRADLETRLTALIASGGQVVHLAIHTFTPVLSGQRRQADLGLLYDPSRHAEKHFCHDWRTLLRQRLPHLKIRFNYPYRGVADGLTRALRARFSPLDYLGVELELNQALLTGDRRFPPPLQKGILDSLRELLSAD